jgi:hypothetical protein
MKRLIIIALIFVLAVPLSQAQLWKMRRWEAVGGIGPSFFFGDIGGFSRTKNVLGFRDLTYRQTRFDLNGDLKYRLTRESNVRLSLTYALLHATDVRGTNIERSMDAVTSIFEPSVIGEYYFVKNRAENSYLFIKGRQAFIKQLLKSLDFYAFTGLGGVAYVVKGNDVLKSNAGFVKSGFSPVIPVGLGATLIYNPNINLGVEVGGRYVFGDYLDGYSNPQYSRANDVYYFLNFTITNKLKTGPHGWPTFR